MHVDYAGLFAVRTRLDARHTALVLVDLQKASASRQHGLGAVLRADGEAERGVWRFDRIEQLVVPNVLRLLTAFRRHGGRVVHLALGSRTGDFLDVAPFLRDVAVRTDNRVGSRDHEFLDELRPFGTESVLVKTTANAFVSTDLDGWLSDRAVRTLVMVGVSTNTCVESAARDAVDRGYDCILVEDACAAANQELHDNTIAGFGRLFGRIASTTEVLDELGWSESEPKETR